VASLRDELELLEITKQEAVQKAMSSQSHELNHFKTMVRALRNEIDQKGSLHQENLQKEKQQKTMEFKQLQETIIELRSKIENDTRRQKK
jgi:hypothetical protein